MPVTWWLTSRGSEADRWPAPPFLSSFLYASFSPASPLVSYIIRLYQKFPSECHGIFTFHSSSARLKSTLFQLTIKLSITFVIIGYLSILPLTILTIPFSLLEKATFIRDRRGSIGGIIVVRRKTLRLKSSGRVLD